MTYPSLAPTVKSVQSLNLKHCWRPRIARGKAISWSRSRALRRLCPTDQRPSERAQPAVRYSSPSALTTMPVFPPHPPSDPKERLVGKRGSKTGIGELPRDVVAPLSHPVC